MSVPAGQEGRGATPKPAGVSHEAWVYLLRCGDGSLYTGWTVDVPRRLARHRAGVASRYTASHLPVELAIALPMADRSAARREEARIKRLTRAQKLRLIEQVSAAGAATTEAAGPSSPEGRFRSCNVYATPMQA